MILQQSINANMQWSSQSLVVNSEAENNVNKALVWWISGNDHLTIITLQLFNNFEVFKRNNINSSMRKLNDVSEFRKISTTCGTLFFFFTSATYGTNIIHEDIVKNWIMLVGGCNKLLFFRVMLVKILIFSFFFFVCNLD